MARSKKSEKFTMNLIIKPEKSKLIKKALDDMALKDYKPEKPGKEELN